jgi:hypothetical protein
MTGVLGLTPKRNSGDSLIRFPRRARGPLRWHAKRYRGRSSSRVSRRRLERPAGGGAELGWPADRWSNHAASPRRASNRVGLAGGDAHMRWTRSRRIASSPGDLSRLPPSHRFHRRVTPDAGREMDLCQPTVKGWPSIGAAARRMTAASNNRGPPTRTLEPSLIGRGRHSRIIERPGADPDLHDQHYSATRVVESSAAPVGSPCWSARLVVDPTGSATRVLAIEPQQVCVPAAATGWSLAEQHPTPADPYVLRVPLPHRASRLGPKCVEFAVYLGAIRTTADQAPRPTRFAALTRKL